MIKKIVFSGILICLFIAIPLAVMGIERVDIGPSFLAFLKNCNYEFQETKLQIPDLMKVPFYENASGWFAVLNVLIFILNMFITVINVVSSILNVVIGVFQFLFILLKNLVYLKDTLASAGA